MRIYYDTEFLEDGRTIDLISIGMVTETGHEYYAVNRDMPTRRIRRHPWLMDNVVPHLPKGYGDLRNTMGKRWLFHYDDPTVKRHPTIAAEVHQFILDAGPDVELWAWYGAYDHVALAQLWGPMIELPEGVPMWTNDLKQEAHRLTQQLRTNGRTLHLPRQQGTEHNALADARHNRVIGRYLQTYELNAGD